MNKQIEQTLDSREVAEMVEKNHKDLTYLSKNSPTSKVGDELRSPMLDI